MSDAGNNTSALLAELLTLPGERRLARVRESLGEFASESTMVTDALVSLGDEAERLAVVEVSRALSASELSVSLADEANAPRARARARRARGQALAYAGRFDEALGLCAEAERIATAHGETIEAARAKLASMHALTKLGRLDEAVASGESARTIFNRAGQPALAARADINLGVAFQHRDDPSAALRFLDRARASLGNEPILQAQVDSNRGEAMLAINDFAGSESAFLSSLHTFQQTGFALGAAIVEGNLADLAARQGLLESAQYHFERARRGFEADASDGHLVRLLAEHAEATGALGLASDAVASYLAVIPRLRELGLINEEARAHAGLGRCLMELDRWDEAESEVSEAAARYRELAHGTALARMNLLLSRIANRHGDRESALTLARNALSVLRDRPLDSALARLQLAEIDSEHADAMVAIAELSAALAIAEELDVAPLRADLLRVRARIRKRIHDAEAAILDLKEAVQQSERVRGTLQAERFRTAFLGSRMGLYEELIKAILERGGQDALAEAFAAVERIKSRALLDLVRGALDAAESQAGAAARPAAAQHDPSESSLIAELARLRKELNALYSRLAPDGRPGERRLAMRPWQEALHEREAALERLQLRLSSTRGLRRLGVGELYADPVKLTEAISLAGTDGALIEYFVTGDDLMAFVITQAEQIVVRDLGAFSKMQDRVARVQFQLRRALRHRASGDDGDVRLLSDVRRELLALWRVVFAPLAPHVADASRLLVVPHGPLHLIPFHALWDGQRFLIEQYEFVYGPSASVLSHAVSTDDEPGADRRSFVIGVADQLAPHIDAEARLVAGILNAGQVLLNGAATTDAFLAAAGDAHVIHLACHGRFSSSTPLASGLRLFDRWLTAREIYGLRLNADLVTLSGCETGRHLVASGDEVLGLVRGFLAAGATSLLVSLWSAHDESTAEMMGRFYQLWHSQDTESLGKAGALRQTQLEALAHRPHPATWAPFVLVGKP